MSDFTSDFWSYYIAIITLVSIVACGVLLQSMSRARVAADPDTTGHVWDEDLKEYNNPLPRWWIWMFWLTLAFSLAYLGLYPGLGSYAGAWKWSSTGQYQDEVKAADAQYGPIFAKFAAMDVKQVAMDADARAIGGKLFLNHCAQCHATDGGGSKGFPNLSDRDWLWGGEPEMVKVSIANGRNGVMPPLGAALGEDGSKDVANYVRSLSGLPVDGLRAQRGKDLFMQNCAACHGAEAKGNPAMGAPNLSDGIWLYGSSEATIIETIVRGRNNAMPAHKDFLGEAKVHLLTAYVWGLSNRGAPATAAPAPAAGDAKK
jgi:cytochrome c oxidase cbb3-type subunit 3